MRKVIITLAAVVAGIAAFGSTAGPAAADVANPIVKYESGYGWSKASCQNFQSRGVFGQYGAQGWFIDGCTISLGCYTPRGCSVSTYTSHGGLRASSYVVTQNARLRRFTSGGAVYGWTDKSCSGLGGCTTQDHTVIGYLQRASIQCNGVLQAPSNRTGDMVNLCRITVYDL
jgi:hypothetical protein